jgi:hypothetical protein
MKLVKMGISLMVAISGFSGIRAQTVDEIVNKYMDATGGKDKIEQIKTLHMEGTYEAMGNQGPTAVDIIRGSDYKLVSQVNGQSMIIVITDKGGWGIIPYMGQTSPTPTPDDAYKQVKGKLDVFGPLYNYAAKGNKVELVGKEGNEYKLKVTDKDNVESLVYIDATSYYMTKISNTQNFMGQPMEVATIFSNFKKTDTGVVLPYVLEISYGGQFSVTSTMTKIDVNKTIDPAIFEMPKS